MSRSATSRYGELTVLCFMYQILRRTLVLDRVVYLENMAVGQRDLSLYTHTGETIFLRKEQDNRKLSIYRSSLAHFMLGYKVVYFKNLSASS